MSTTVYCLELEGGYYYIGKTHNVNNRYYAHVDGDGPEWTRIHPPVGVLEVIENADSFDEDKTVKRYMSIYGIDMVRGGTYVRENLSQAERCFLQREIWMAQDRCIRCGRGNHTVARCHATTDVNDQVLFDPLVECLICNRQGHETVQCYAKTIYSGADR